MAFDPTKPVQTRDGRAARILATDVDVDGDTIAAYILSTDDLQGQLITTNANGSFWGDEDPLDLVNIPETSVEYRVLYYNKSIADDFERAYVGSSYGALENAAANDKFLGGPRVGILKFTEVDGKLTSVELVSE